MRIVIIGSGNVATILGRKIKEARHEIIQVFSRKDDHASRLANELNAGYTADPADIDTNGDLYLIAIADAALYHIHTWLNLNNKFIVHTAGSIPMEVLKMSSSHFGVLYPLQSLRKEIPHIPEIPLLVDANSDENKNLLLNFAKTLSANVLIANDEQREKLHLAAVITNNFTNHLYSLTQDFCRTEKVDFNILLPLISELSTRLSYGPAANYQTGPAIRKDQVTIDHHLVLLKEYPSLLKLYELFTASIMKMHAPQ